MNTQVDPTSSNLSSAMLNSKIRPRVVVGYGVKTFHPSPPNYVTRSPGNYWAALPTPFGKLANYESCCDQPHLATSRPVISCETASILRRLSLRYLTANVAKTLNKNGVRLINKLITLAVLLFFKNQGKLYQFPQIMPKTMLAQSITAQGPVSRKSREVFGPEKAGLFIWCKGNKYKNNCKV